MLGCGHTKPKRRIAAPTSLPEVETAWTTLDMDPEVEPDVVFNLAHIEVGGKLPFPADTFDEIHAYEVLEHYGSPGNFKGFFTGMQEYWRLLKPGGHLLGTSPAWNSRWAWGDPGHVRVIQEEQFFFLEKQNYVDYLANTSMTDYSKYVRPYWWHVRETRIDGGCFTFCLEKAVVDA